MGLLRKGVFYTRHLSQAPMQEFELGDGLDVSLIFNVSDLYTCIEESLMCP